MFRAAERLGVWPSALLNSAAITLATNIIASLVFWVFNLPGYSARPAYGAFLFIVPFVVALPVSYVVFVALDRARRAEARAIENEAKFRDLAEGSVQGLCIQRNFNALYCNRAFAEIFGFDSVADALAFGSMLPLLPQASRSAALERSREIRQTGRARDATHSALRKDGTEIWVESYVQPVKWDGEDAVQLTVLDVSERRQIDRMKNEFVSTVSHELRTPLTSIKGALGLLDSGMVGHISDRAREIVAIASDNSDRLIRLINDILDIERIEAGRISLRPEAINATSLVRLSVDQATGLAHSEGVSLSLADADLDITATGDRDQLLQVLGNLIANAVKFSPRGGDVILRVAQRDEAVRFSVTDRGPGVPEAFKPHIFGKFTQADGSTARKFGGTGLGLHICKLIVERHEGRIGFESTPGGDTTFYFEIPSIVALGEPRRLAAE
ncbi:MAG: ATP-binding protein [Proteobacteria bacterium]|nr:ATP-binding protein [Pseudomonadota bacterium]MDA1058834.1 ATP-binding protein [Pseudomonadota bacterium]